MTSSRSVGWPQTIPSSIPWMAVTNGGIARHGLTSDSNVATTSPASTIWQATSTTAHLLGSIPVVSTSMKAKRPSRIGLGDMSREYPAAGCHQGGILRVCRLVGGTFRSLNGYNYRIWAVGALVSNIGSWMQRTAQDWLVLTR